MFRRFFTWLQTTFGYIWLIVLAGYFSVLAGQAMYRNYQSQQDARQLNTQLAEARLEKEKWESLLVYYKTDDFKVKELRRSLLLKLPNEKVYALPESAIGLKAEEAAVVKQKAQDVRLSQPTWRQWLDYVVDGPRV